MIRFSTWLRWTPAYSSLHKLEGGWVQTLSLTDSEIFEVDKNIISVVMVDGIQGNHMPIIKKASQPNETRNCCPENFRPLLQVLCVAK